MSASSARVSVRSSFRAAGAPSAKPVQGAKAGKTVGKTTTKAAAPTPASRRQAAVYAPSPLLTYHLLLGSTMFLLGLGLVMVLSASSVTSYRDSGSSFTVFEKQAMWLVVGLPLLIIATRLPVRFYRAMAYPALAVVLILLALVPIFGVSVNGNRNWLSLGGLKIQPAEPAKLALIIWSADLLARKVKLLGQWRHLVIPMVPVALLMVGLVLLGNDLGTAMVLLAIVFGMLFFAGAPLRLFGMALGVGAAGVWAAAKSSPNRMARIASWWSSDTAANMSWNYQALHGKYALANGGLWGLGLGASREKWGALPEAHNDFIFAVIGEELGLVGTLVVLVLFALVAFAGLRIAMAATDPFVRLVTAGITTWLSIQALVNIAVVVGLLPVVGLALPLVSYGGSALLPTMVALGLLLSFARADYRAQIQRANARDWVPRSRQHARNRRSNGGQPIPWPRPGGTHHGGSAWPGTPGWGHTQ